MARGQEEAVLIRVRTSGDRGITKLDWLDSRHSFSFGDYYDPEHAGFLGLRVINEDVIAPGGGFPPHPHRDMEIVTFVLEGALEHADSLGHGSVIRPGEIQRMTAGRGIVHSESNASKTEPVHLLQIWILPERTGKAPAYEQHPYERREGAVLLSKIHEDASLWVVRGAEVRALERSAWVQVARGDARVNGTRLHAGDGAAVTDEARLEVEGEELLLFELSPPRSGRPSRP